MATELLNSQLPDAVARLIRQLEINDWSNRDGQKIIDNVAFRDVKTILSRMRNSADELDPPPEPFHDPSLA